MLNHLQEFLFILVDEIENKACAILKFDQETLFFSEVPSLNNINDFDKRPVFLDWFILSQNEGGELQMRILLESGEIFEPK